MIKMLVTDIDGVLTDGKLYLSENGKENKTICFKDLDTVSEIKQENIGFAIITGENNYFTEYIKTKFRPDYFFAGCKTKKKAIMEIMEKEKLSSTQICYIGDGKYDIQAIDFVGLGVCPNNAVEEAKEAADIVLRANGGEGCLADIFTYIKGINLCENREKINIQSDNFGFTLDTILFQHKEVIEQVLKDEDLKQNIEKSILLIKETLKHGGQILFCGNGGSAADAQHLATEFVSRFYLERKALNAEALTVNTSSITAISNDYEYSKVFARQVEAKGKKNDILIGISTSGTSKSVLEAFKSAEKLGMKRIAFTGDNKCGVEPLTDIVISIPTDVTPRIQEMHIMIGHIICERVEKELCDR